MAISILDADMRSFRRGLNVLQLCSCANGTSRAQSAELENWYELVYQIKLLKAHPDRYLYNVNKKRGTKVQTANCKALELTLTVPAL